MGSISMDMIFFSLFRFLFLFLLAKVIKTV